MSTQRRIDLSTLDPQQIIELKKNTDEEINHFTTSLSVLNTATSRLNECIKNIDHMATSGEVHTDILVPLTSSLYVPGKIKSNDKFLVDIGTGYFVEKNGAGAKAVYQKKIAKLGLDAGKIQEILKQKNETSRVLNGALRDRLIEAENNK